MAEQYGSTRSYRILVYGNNFVKSSELFEKLQLSYPGNNCTGMAHARFEFYAYPDLDLFNRFQEPPIDSKIDNLILRTDGVGISLFIILISQTEVFSNEMKDMITEVPQNSQSINEKYFWDHAIVLFSFEDKIRNNHNEVMSSIEGNKGIREVVGRAGNRYIWMSDSSTKEEIQKAILSQCEKIERGHSPPVHGNPQSKTLLQRIGKHKIKLFLIALSGTVICGIGYNFRKMKKEFKFLSKSQKTAGYISNIVNTIWVLHTISCIYPLFGILNCYLPEIPPQTVITSLHSIAYVPFYSLGSLV